MAYPETGREALAVSWDCEAYPETGREALAGSRGATAGEVLSRQQQRLHELIFQRLCSKFTTNTIYTFKRHLCSFFADDNECLRNNGGCHLEAACINTEGSFHCMCDDGFDGNGYDCRGRTCEVHYKVLFHWCPPAPHIKNYLPLADIQFVS